MRELSRVPAIAGTCLGCLASAVGAQQVDMDLMTKWSAVTVVRYAVVGEFAGEPTLLFGALGFKRQARVTDRVELTFDWNQNEMALVGTPTFKNFPSKVSVTPVAGCPPARISGAYEHMDVLSVKQLSPNGLQLAAKRSSPAGSIPYAGESTCGAAWDSAAAKVETADIGLLVLPTMYFGMPSGVPGLSISPDRKSIVLVEQNSGWTWTYTPTPVK